MGQPTVYYPPSKPVNFTTAIVIIAVMFGLPMLLGIGSAVFEAIRSRAPSRPASAPPTLLAAPKKSTSIARRQPMLYDVNGDGAEDVIVWLTSDGALAAFDGNNGEMLWQAESQGVRVVDEARSALFEGHIVVDYDRNIYGIDAKTGKSLWKTPMDGRMGHVCARGPNHLQLTTEEPECSRVDLATGKLTPEKEVFKCLPIWRDIGVTTEPLEAPGNVFNTSNSRSYYHFHRLPKVTGPTVEYALFTVNGLRILLGYRKPGRIPIALAMRNSKEVWRADIPASATRGNGTPPAATLSHGRLITVHDADGPWKLTVLEASSGKRLWEVALPAPAENLMSIRASDRVVFVRQDSFLTAFAFKDGRKLYEIGR